MSLSLTLSRRIDLGRLDVLHQQVRNTIDRYRSSVWALYRENPTPLRDTHVDVSTLAIARWHCRYMQRAVDVLRTIIDQYNPGAKVLHPAARAHVVLWNASAGNATVEEALDAMLDVETAVTAAIRHLKKRGV